jgi:hypothetical protein|tara:strand:- start:714 stop:944 length:231 start_codon:yes stop_codon:yes gene_type:complete
MSMRENILGALKKHAYGNIELHKMNIEVYLKNPAGIGEHSDIMEAIQGELDKMAMHEDRLDVIDNWIEDHRVLVRE